MPDFGLRVCVCDNQIVMRRHIKCSQLKKMRIKQKVHIRKASLAFKLSVWDCHFVGSITMSWFWERALKCETFPIHTSCNQHHYLWMFSASINTFLMKLAPSHQRVYQVSIRLSLQVVLTYHLLFGLNLFHIQLMLYQWRLSSFFIFPTCPKLNSEPLLVILCVHVCWWRPPPRRAAFVMLKVLSGRWWGTIELERPS